MINPGDVEILLVEDSAIQAEILRRKLVQEGYQVSVAVKPGIIQVGPVEDQLRWGCFTCYLK